MLHPMISCAIKAQPILDLVFKIFQQHQWVLQGHESWRSIPARGDSHGDNATELRSYFGPRKSGGGLRIVLSSDLSPSDRAEEKEMDHDCDQIHLDFIFYEGGKRVSSMGFRYDMNRPQWWVDHGYYDNSRGVEKDALAVLLERLGRDPADEEEPINDGSKAMEMIATVAEFTYDHCNK